MTSTATPTSTTSTSTAPAAADDRTTPLENAEASFVASDRLLDNLQRVLVDLIDLQLSGKQAHWNIVGPNFRDLHLNLDEVVDVARQGTDVIAERMRALHATPDGRTGVVAGNSSLPLIPAGEIGTHAAIDVMVQAVGATVGTMRAVHDEVDEDDPTTADILHEYIASLEQQAWFLSAETRSPQ